MHRFPVLADQGPGDLQRLVGETPCRQHSRQRRERRTGCGRAGRLAVQRPPQHLLRPFQAAQAGTGDSHVMEGAGIVGRQSQRLLEQGCRSRLVSLLQQVGRHFVQQAGGPRMAPDQVGDDPRRIGRST